MVEHWSLSWFHWIRGVSSEDTTLWHPGFLWMINFWILHLSQKNSTTYYFPFQLPTSRTHPFYTVYIHADTYTTPGFLFAAWIWDMATSLADIWMPTLQKSLSSITCENVRWQQTWVKSSLTSHLSFRQDEALHLFTWRNSPLDSVGHLIEMS